MTTNTAGRRLTLGSEFDELTEWAPQWLVGLACVGWAFWFGRLAVRSWNGFWFGVFDVGIFDQGVWLLSRLEEPFITLRGLNMFGDHSSWVLLLVAPLYWIWPHINLLVILAVLTPATAAWLSFRIGLAEGLGKWAAAAVAVAFLLHPAVAWTAWDSFHPETVAIALIPAAYLVAKRGHPWLFVTLGIVAAAVKEDAFLVLIPLAIYVGWRWKPLRNHAVGFGLIVAALAVFNFGVALPSFSPTGELIYTGRYTWDLGEIVTWSRVGYLIAMLAPLPVALFAPRVLAIAGPVTAANLASTFIYQQEIRWHYTAYLLGVLAVAAPVGLKRIYDSWGDDVGLGVASATRRFTIPITFPLLAVALASLLLVGPALTFIGDWGGASPERQEQINQAIQQIPDEAVVAASHTIAPHLGHRREIYMLPNPWVADSWGVSADVPPRPDPSVVEWLVVNYTSAGETERRVVEDAKASGWTVVDVGDQFEVLRAPEE